MINRILKKAGRLSAMVLVLLGVGLVILGGSCGGGGTDPKPLPSIELISVGATDILPGEIVTIVFTTANTDSVIFYPGGSTVSLADTITLPVQLFTPTTLRLIAVNSVGLDSLIVEVTMSSATAVINDFSVGETVIVGGDSTLLSWSVTDADSIVVNNSIGKLSGNNGTLWLKPTGTTTYRAIAYYIGHDTSTVSVTVEIFAAIEATEGTFFKGNLGSQVLEPPWGFRIRTTDNQTATKLWIHFDLVEGDGTLLPDSILSGGAQPTYNFSGALGHAIVRVKVPGVDSVDVFLRANTLIPGPGGQGQFIRFDDNYAWVETYNGIPDTVAQDPRTGKEWLLYADYESALGVVIMVIDLSGEGDPGPTEPILGVIVNTVYDKTTPEGIGIGSSYNDLLAAYGVPDTAYLDPTDPPADVYEFDSLGAVFFAQPADSVIFEIHLIDPTPAAPAGKLTPPGRYLPRRLTR